MLQNKFNLITILFAVWILFIFPKKGLVIEVDRKYDSKEWGQDPFISYFELKEKEEKLREKQIEKQRSMVEVTQEEKWDRDEVEKGIKKMLFTGTLKGKEKLAIIDGDICGEGEKIKGKKIVEIEDEYVILSEKGFNFKLELEEQALIQTKSESSDGSDEVGQEGKEQLDNEDSVEEEDDDNDDQQEEDEDDSDS